MANPPDYVRTLTIELNRRAINATLAVAGDILGQGFPNNLALDTIHPIELALAESTYIEHLTGLR